MEQEIKNSETVNEEIPVITFDEILEDKQYQQEFDRRISKAIDTAVTNAKGKWEQELKSKQAESEKLAKMDEEQKRTYEIEQANKRALTAESELNAYKLKDESIRQASEKGVDLDLMQTLDYTKETAESIKTKIDIFASASKKIHEKAISEYSKEPTPQTGDRNIVKDESQMTYSELCKLSKYQEK